jgi:hypothetical protein
MNLNEMVSDPRLKRAELAFAALVGGEERASIKAIAVSVKDTFNMECEVRLSRSLSGKFFGMQIYPSTEEVERVTLRVVRGEDGSARFEKCSGVVIVIDRAMLDGSFSPRELTACLIHEVGHKVNWSTSVNKVLTVLGGISNLIKVGKLIVAGISLTSIIGFLVGMMLSSSIGTIVIGTVEEVVSDSLAVTYGYGPELHSSLTKVSSRVSGRDDSMFTRVSALIGVIPSLGFRKASIIGILRKERAMASSEYERDLIDDQLEVIARSGS